MHETCLRVSKRIFYTNVDLKFETYFSRLIVNNVRLNHLELRDLQKNRRPPQRKLFAWLYRP
jgi:hypothetical protein